MAEFRAGRTEIPGLPEVRRTPNSSKSSSTMSSIIDTMTQGVTSVGVAVKGRTAPEKSTLTVDRYIHKIYYKAESS